MITSIKFSLLLIFAAGLFLLNVLNVPVAAQETAAPLVLTAQELTGGKIIESNNLSWKFQAGDDAAWANPNYDDAAWSEISSPRLTLDKLPADWNGTGWFRLRFRTDEELRGKLIGVMFSQTMAASEIYLDGELVREFGDTGDGAGAAANFVRVFGSPFAARLSGADEHLLAVRYRSLFGKPDTPFLKWAQEANGGDGFYLAIGDLNTTIARREQNLRASVSSMISRAAIFLAVGLLYLLLFWFYPPQRANLYFGIYAFLNAVSGFNNYLQTVNSSSDLMYYAIYRASGRVIFLLYGLAFLLFLYRAFLPRAPRYFLLICIVWTASNAATLILPSSSISNGVFGIMTVVFVFESMRVITLAVWRRIEAAWIVAVGVVTSLIGPLRYLYLAMGLTISSDVDYYLSYISSYGILIAVSIYLAYNFARINRNLSRELENVQKLSAQALEHEQERAENARRVKELKEARQLQLSMLPKKLPQIKSLEIAAFMKPATEVGGDYYDFHVGADGTLTVAVGDATGHGLKAGTVVTATKGLFNNLADASDIPNTFGQISKSLKAMNLRGLFMAMTMLKVKDNHLSICAAGMPSTLIYRAVTKTVEEISLRAVPLGSMTNTNYRGQELVLDTGDCVVVMSDGFPEMFNQENEMLGFDKAAEVLKGIAMNSPQEIIDRFVEVSQKWAGARPADDDVTFVVLKVKQTKNGN